MKICGEYLEDTEEYDNEQDILWVLGAFTIIAKSTRPSLCPPVHFKQLCSQWMDFRDSIYCGDLLKCVDGIQFLVKIGQK
jgi:hypothetical protein